MKKFVLSVIFISLLIFLIIPFCFLHNEDIEPDTFLNLLWIIPLSITALFQEQLKTWCFSPELEIKFELKPPYCSKTPFFVSKNNKEVLNTEAYYFRIKVNNKGKRAAKLCEVVMTKLLIEENGQFREVKYFQQAGLKWSRDKSNEASYITINPSPIEILCDIGYISKGFESTLFHLNYLYTIGGYQPSVLTPNKKYRFTIGVISENAKLISKTFEFYWTGNWKNNDKEMFKEITIKEIE